jgi:DNA-binding GntR family transcriptional regulator
MRDANMKSYKSKTIINNKKMAPKLILKKSVKDYLLDGISHYSVPTFQPVKKQQMQDVIYEALKDAIIKGLIPPGTKLEINELANNFGTSPMPIREALSRLVESGVLVTEPNKSVLVPLLETNDLVELLRIRMMIEGVAGIWAAEHITEEEVEQINSYCDSMSNCIRQKDKGGATEFNQKIHFGIYAAARSRKLLSIIEKLWMQNGPYLGLFNWDVYVAGDIFHRKMLKGLQNRDGLAVQHFIETDLFDALSSLLNMSLPDEIRPSVYFAKNRSED